MTRTNLVATGLALGIALCTGVAAAQGSNTLAAVKARGHLLCGAHPGAPGFSQPNSRGEYTGFDADHCRAIAAAIFGDPQAIRFRPLSSQQRLTAVQTGEIDVLIRTTTWSMARDTTSGLNVTNVTFYDGQGFLVRTKLGLKSAKELDGATICVTSGTTNELNLADWARANNLRIQPLVIDQNDETRKAYESGRCDAFTTDASQLAGIRTALPVPAEHVVLPDIISKEPLGPYVRHGDDQWFDLVRWTMFALVEAEELGVTSKNVDEMLKAPNPNIQRLLGVSGGFGKMIGLDDRWAYNAIKAVGNYGEIFDRNLGKESPLGLARGINALWNKGGLIYAPPIR
ncbi:MAG: amino acid ABC transporter substrate-binding protein [Alphaproteobacteria bacterium]|nr:amino acid ABC transporter substrate-binding protein [Alphaproteobacteria bacterium]